MVSSLSKFVALFNLGILQLQRRILVDNTLINKRILSLFVEKGYILSYSILNPHTIEIFYNFSYSRFKIVTFSKSTTNFISYHKLRSRVNSGRVLFISTSKGFMLSETALMNKIGGSVIFEIKFI